MTVASGVGVDAVPAGRAGRRLGIVTIDQAVSGGSNILAAVVAAQWLDPGSFGTFGLLFLVYGLILGVFRSVVGIPLLVRPLESRERLGEIFGFSWSYGAAAGLCSLLVGAALWFADAETALGFLILGLACPLLVLQDLGRFLAIGMLRPMAALWLDMLWLMLMLVAAGLMAVSDWHNLPAVVVMWAGSGMVAGAVAIVASRAPRLEFSRRWIAGSWDLSWRFAAAFAAAQVTVLLYAVMLRGVLGPAILGALIGVQLLMRPYMLVESAVLGSGFAEIAHEPRDLMLHVRRVTAVATVVATINGLAMILLPDALGEMILGKTWDSAELFILPFAVQLVLLGAAIGPRIGIVAIGRYDAGLWLSLAFMPLLLALCTVGAVAWGAVASAWAAGLSLAIAAVTWWIFFEWLRRKPIDDAQRARGSTESFGSPSHQHKII